MSGPDPDWTLAAIKAQAEEILRVAGRAERSQEAEVLMMASVGRAGLALAHLVRHWFRQQEYEAKTALTRPHRIEVPPELVREFQGRFGSEVTLEFDTTPILPLNGIEAAEPKCPFEFAHTRHWCGYEGCRDA
jgi:hypothetical protein